jgi:DNA-binding beta-propeller fold protein YncE
MRRYLVVAPMLPGVLLGALLAGCGGSSGRPADRAGTPSPSDQPFVMPLQGPVGLAQAADGAVWAAWSGSDAIAPVTADGGGGKRVGVGDTPLRIHQLDGSLWVTTIRDGGLAEVDPASGSVVRTVTLGGEPEGLTDLDGHLFVVLQKDGVLAEVDPATGDVVRRYDVGGEPRLVAPGAGALYVGDFARGRVVWVQPGSDRVRRTARVCAGVQDLLVLDGTVWAACMTDNRVIGLDPRTLAVTRRIHVAGDPDGLAAGPGDDLLVSLQDGPGLATVDRAGGTVRRQPAGTSGRLYDVANNDVLERDGTAYVSDFTANRVAVIRLAGS